MVFLIAVMVVLFNVVDLPCRATLAAVSVTHLRFSLPFCDLVIHFIALWVVFCNVFALRLPSRAPLAAVSVAHRCCNLLFYDMVIYLIALWVVFSSSSRQATGEGHRHATGEGSHASAKRLSIKTSTMSPSGQGTFASSSEGAAGGRR
mmetsp:Transcript_40435/g.101573  ORF Transcript_40435/g.101573 Transcript_40435/m.101573 type:complete len:148 (-) Transcript_40435:18-461(-)